MDKNSGDGSSLLGRILVPALIALLVGTSSPWWWDKAFPPETTTPVVGVTESTGGTEPIRQVEVSDAPASPDTASIAGTWFDSDNVVWNIAQNGSAVTIEVSEFEVFAAGSGTFSNGQLTATLSDEFGDTMQVNLTLQGSNLLSGTFSTSGWSEPYSLTRS